MQNNDFVIIDRELNGKTLSELNKQGYERIDIKAETDVERIIQFYKLNGSYLKIDGERGTLIEDPNSLSFVKRIYELDVDQTINENTNIPSATNVSEIEKM